MCNTSLHTIHTREREYQDSLHPLRPIIVELAIRSDIWRSADSECHVRHDDDDHHSVRVRTYTS